MVQMNLFAKRRERHRHRGQAHGYKGGSWGGMAWEIGIIINTLLCIKQVTSENLLYNANSTQCSWGTYMGRKSKKGEVCVNT